MSVFVEESWVLVGEVQAGIWFGRLIGHQRGEAASVGFSWRRVLRREELRGDVVGFLHTHPSGLLAPSARDVRTMAAWCSCFGKPLLCAILAGQRLAGFLFNGERYRPVERIVRLSKPQALVGVAPEEDHDAG
jgi:hypothetical protein